MTAQIGEFVFPGDILKEIKSSDTKTIIGPGLQRNEEEPNTLVVTQPGKLVFKPPSTYWIEGKRSRYIPKKGDFIVGIVTKKSGDILRVDIGSAEFASLSMLAFEGATKKQKPDVNVGDVVYARVVNAFREMEPELVCIDSYSKAGKLGVLSNDGFLINISLNLAYRLLNIENPLLRALGKKTPFEIAIGINGKVWINAKRTQDVLNIVKALQASEFQDDAKLNQICNKFK